MSNRSMSNRSMSYRLQHTIPATCVFAVAMLVTWLSYTQEPADAYIFPRMISIAFGILAIWNLIRALMGWAKVGEGVDLRAAANFLPGILIVLVLMLFGAEYFGFYVSSFVAFFVIYSMYDPAPLSAPLHWVKRLIVAAVFMAVIYGLFAKLLFVQTPRGLFF